MKNLLVHQEGCDTLGVGTPVLRALPGGYLRVSPSVGFVLFKGPFRINEDACLFEFCEQA